MGLAGQTSFCYNSTRIYNLLEIVRQATDVL